MGTTLCSELATKECRNRLFNGLGMLALCFFIELCKRFKGQEAICPDLDSTKLVITADGAYTEVNFWNICSFYWHLKLAIFDAKRNDGGFYNCRIENVNGVREHGCHVFIREGGPGGPGGSQRSANFIQF